MKAIRYLLTIIACASLLGAVACGQAAAKPTPTPAPANTPAPTATPKATATQPVHAGTIAYGKTDQTQQMVDIYLIHTDGSGLTELTSLGGRTASQAWSPDGSKIAFVRGENQNMVWVMNADGSDQKPLMRWQDGNWPAWSRDGRQIVFNSWPDYLLKCDDIQIYLVNVDSRDVRRVMDGPGCDIIASFAPDGKILFIRLKNFADIPHGGGDVFAINPDGTGLVQLTTSGHIVWYALSPDGTMLALHDKNQQKIVIQTMDGSQPPRTLIDNDFTYDLAQIAWSLDGKALAIARASFSHIYGFPLYIVNADGSGLTKVPNADDAFSIAWRPE